MSKPKYKTHVLPRLLEIEAWCRDGVVQKEIAKNIDVAYSTFRKYRDHNKALAAALEKGREVADIMVENALFKRSQGYDYDEVTKEECDSEKGSYTKTKTVTKHVNPDVTAQIFWLKNRKPEEWRDIKAQEITGKGGKSIKINVCITEDDE